ncbi:MAG: UDP-N-acetylmuramoyl-L-alanine--D-glutamate ligase [Patescibacteria group bacterium]
MKLEELKNKKILVVGLGLEGKASMHFLKHTFPYAVIDGVDQKDGSRYLDKQYEYDLAIKSPGVKSDLIKILYTTASNIFFANTKGLTVGVTGTKGKSTTASLIYEMLKTDGRKVHLVGNIGKPMLEELLGEHGEDDVYVCELSSYQLSDIHYSPHVAVFIDFFPEHMDYHGSVEKYLSAKVNIVAFSTPKDYFVYNPIFRELRKIAEETKAQSIPFVETLPFPDADIPLVGEHNKDNVRAAITVGKIFGVTENVMHSATKNFKPLPHRLQNIGTYKGITFYDDAISTTPESTIRAILALGNIGTILVGGQDRGYEFISLAETIVKHNIGNVIYFPQSGDTIASILKSFSGNTTNLFRAESMEDAVKICYENTPMNTICLLSCASPSYSLWKNFEEKGDLFQKFVKKYGQ